MGRIELKTAEELRFMREAGLVVATIHEKLRDAVRPGVTTAELDAVSSDTIAGAGAASNFLGYYGYPATVCVSVNDVVVHGIPGDYRLRAGDLVSFDCGAWLTRRGRQWHGDAAFSVVVSDPWIDDAAFAAGERAAAEPAGGGQGPESAVLRRRRELDAVTRECLWAALAALATGRRVSAVGAAVEDVVAARARELGWEAGIIEEYTGHGIGTRMHMEPEVLNFNARGRSPRLKRGMALAVEPMLVSGGTATRTEDDGWTVRTEDGGDAAHWEHTIAIAEGGVCVLTARDGGAAGLAPYGVAPVSLD